MRTLTLLLTAAGLALFLGARPAAATPIALGNLSFNVTIPSGLTPGEATFTIQNLTGAWEVAPSYPAATEVDFTNSSLVIQFSNSGQTINLGTITPGVLDDTVNAALGVSLANPVISATFTATLQGLPFQLDSSLGGAMLTASANLTGTLSDSAGSLQDGDNVDLVVDAQPVSTVPEPLPLLLLASGLVLFAGLRRAGWAR